MQPSLMAIAETYAWSEGLAEHSMVKGGLLKLLGCIALVICICIVVVWQPVFNI